MTDPMNYHITDPVTDPMIDVMMNFFTGHMMNLWCGGSFKTVAMYNTISREENSFIAEALSGDV